MNQIKLSSKNENFLNGLIKNRSIYLLEIKAEELEKLKSFVKEAAKKLKLNSNDNSNDFFLILVEFLKCLRAMGIKILAKGRLNILAKGYGFLRYPENNFSSGALDIYVSINQIKRFNLKEGQEVECTVDLPKDKNKCLSMLQLIKNDDFVQFEALDPVLPHRKLDLHLNHDKDDKYKYYLTSRLIDIICPLAKGQRALVVAPAKSGKTVLIKALAKAISTNHPEVDLIILLIDERPEEVTDIKEFMGGKGKVYHSSFDESSERHIEVAEMVFRESKAKIERDNKKDIVILLDSITKLTKAFNFKAFNSGKIMPGGIEPSALRSTKALFGLGRQLKSGGSLTIIATALMDNLSKIAEIIFEEFKGTGNSEIVLDREIAEKYGLYPPINIIKSATRREEEICSNYQERDRLRRMLVQFPSHEGLRMIIEKLQQTRSNDEFLEQIKALEKT